MSALAGLRSPQVNKFEQVSSLRHQMSLVLGGIGWDVPVQRGPMSRVGRDGARASRSFYGEAQCIMCNGHMGSAL